MNVLLIIYLGHEICVLCHLYPSGIRCLIIRVKCVKTFWHFTFIDPTRQNLTLKSRFSFELEIYKFDKHILTHGHAMYLNNYSSPSIWTGYVHPTIKLLKINVDTPLNLLGKNLHPPFSYTPSISKWTNPNPLIGVQVLLVSEFLFYCVILLLKLRCTSV